MGKECRESPRSQAGRQHDHTDVVGTARGREPGKESNHGSQGNCFVFRNKY